MLKALENNNIKYEYIGGNIFITLNGDDEVKDILNIITREFKNSKRICNISIRGIVNNRLVQIKINNKSVRIIVNCESTYIVLYPNLLLLRDALCSNKQKLKVLEIKVINKLKYKRQFENINTFVDVFIEHLYIMYEGFIWTEDPIEISCNLFTAVMEINGMTVKVKISNYTSLAEVLKIIETTLKQMEEFDNIIIEFYDKDDIIQLSLVILLHKLYTINFTNIHNKKLNDTIFDIDNLLKSVRDRYPLIGNRTT